MLHDDVSAPTFRVELTAAEMRIVQAALRSFDNDFGHDERDVHDQVRAVMRKLPDPRRDDR
jgi:hypothetical protein